MCKIIIFFGNNQKEMKKIVQQALSDPLSDITKPRITLIERIGLRMSCLCFSLINVN